MEVYLGKDRTCVTAVVAAMLANLKQLTERTWMYAIYGQHGFVVRLIQRSDKKEIQLFQGSQT
jgi:hypothetical protein